MHLAGQHICAEMGKLHRWRAGSLPQFDVSQQVNRQYAPSAATAGHTQWTISGYEG